MENKHNKGQSLFEVVIVLGIIVLVVLALIYSATSSIKNSSYATNNTVAYRVTQEALEWLRNQRDKNFKGFLGAANARPDYCLDTLGDIAVDGSGLNSGTCNSDEAINSIFYRELTFVVDTTTGKTIIRATVNTSWSDGGGKHQVSSSTEFSDWREM